MLHNGQKSSRKNKNLSFNAISSFMCGFSNTKHQKSDTAAASIFRFQELLSILTDPTLFKLTKKGPPTR